MSTETAPALLNILTKGLRDLLARLSDTRMYPTPDAVADIMTKTADWITTDANTARPFVPTSAAAEQARHILADFLPAWASPYVGSYPEQTIAQVATAGAEHVVALFKEAGLLIPTLPDTVEASALNEAIAYVTGRTVLREGTMGSGYYDTYVSPEDLAAALYAAGWRKSAPSTHAAATREQPVEGPHDHRAILTDPDPSSDTTQEP